MTQASKTAKRPPKTRERQEALNLYDRKGALTHSIERAKLSSTAERLAYDIGRSAATPETRSEVHALENLHGPAEIEERFPAEDFLQALYDLIDQGDMSVEEASLLVKSLKSQAHREIDALAAEKARLELERSKRRRPRN